MKRGRVEAATGWHCWLARQCCLEFVLDTLSFDSSTSILPPQQCWTSQWHPHADIRTVQELLGHKDVRTTMIYVHVMNKPGLAVKSPADVLG